MAGEENPDLGGDCLDALFSGRGTRPEAHRSPRPSPKGSIVGIEVGSYSTSGFQRECCKFMIQSSRGIKTF